MPIGPKLLRHRFVDSIERLAVVQLLLIYFQDVHVWRFLLHLILIHGPLSPVIRARGLPVENVQHRGALVLVLATFAWGIVAHVRWPLPDAGSKVDGRLHGALLTEFVGSLPVCRAWIVAWDVLLMLLELALFTVTYNEILVLREATVADAGYPYGPEPTISDIYSGCSVVYTVNFWDAVRRNWQLEMYPRQPSRTPGDQPGSSQEMTAPQNQSQHGQTPQNQSPHDPNSETAATLDEQTQGQPNDNHSQEAQGV